jgi:hypothetical protein
MTRLKPALVALLLITGGCQGLLGGGDASDGETATPSQTTTELPVYTEAPVDRRWRLSVSYSANETRVGSEIDVSVATEGHFEGVL